MIDHFRLNEYQLEPGTVFALQWHVEDLLRHFLTNMRDGAKTMRPLRSNQSIRALSGPGLVDGNHRQVAIVEKLLMIRAQTPARDRVHIKLITQPLIQQKIAGIVGVRAYLADSLLHRNK